LDVEPVGTLARAKTTLNVPANVRERVMGETATVGASQSALPRGDGVSAATVISRGNTTMTTGRPGQAGVPIRGLTVRRPRTEDVSSPVTSPKSSAQTPSIFLFYAPDSLSHLSEGSSQTTEFYDNLVDSYIERSPPLSANNSDRVAKWAQGAAGGPSRASSRSGTLRRRVTRRAVAPSAYDEEEEGYGSGEWDEMYELTKIRVKIHFEGDIRGMALDPQLSFAEFRQLVADKFETRPQAIILKFRDEDGGKVSLRDSSDYDLAIETARESAKGKPEGKLELWCERK
jgi:PB1 domain